MAGGDHGAMAAVHIVCTAPCLGSVARTEVCYSAYVKTSLLCDTASRARTGERGPVDGELWVTAHFMGTVCIGSSRNDAGPRRTDTEKIRVC